MHEEVLELKKYCDEIGVEAKLEPLWEGHAIRFNNDGSECGCVE